MNIFCSKCGQHQLVNEKLCTKCGFAYGQKLWVLIAGILLAIFLPIVILLSGQSFTGKSFGLLFFAYILPILVGTACLYDYDGRRVKLYFWIGALVIFVGFLAVTSE